MIVVWNRDRCQIYGFPNLNYYKAFARESERDVSVWDDDVYDVGDEGGECTDDNQLDMCEFNYSLAD